MKKLIPLLFVFALLVTSCGVKPTGYNIVREDPYIQLKNGKKIEGQKIKMQGGLFTGLKMSIDGQEFNEKEVALHSDGKSTFAHTRSGWAEKIMGEDIKVYDRSVTTVSQNSSGGTTRSTESKVYIQYGNSLEFKKFNYRNLKPLIAEDAASQKLKNGHILHIVGNIITYGGLATVFAGGYITYRGAMNDNISTTGLIMIPVGAGLFFTGLPFRGAGIKRIYDAVNMHNVSKSKKAKK